MSEPGRVWFLKKCLCMKIKFPCTLNAIIRGSLCSSIDQFTAVFLSFPFEFVSEKHFIQLFPFFFFLFSFPVFLFSFSFFFLLANQQGGGQSWPPCAPLSYASAVIMSIVGDDTMPHPTIDNPFRLSVLDGKDLKNRLSDTTVIYRCHIVALNSAIL